jgi:hypothetical protein
MSSELRNGMPLVFRVPGAQERRAALVLSDGSPILFARFDGEEKAFHIGCCWSAYLAGNRLNERDHDMMSNIYSVEQNRSLAALRNVVSTTNATATATTAVAIPVTSESLSVILKRLTLQEAALKAEMLALLSEKKEKERQITERRTAVQTLEAQVERLKRDLAE